MKKHLVFLVGAVLAITVWSCGKTWEIPIAKKLVVAQIEKQFPLEKGGLLTIKLTNPKVQFDGARSKVIIDLDVTVSAPLGLAAGNGAISVESNLGYNADKKSVVLKDPALRDITIANFNNDKVNEVKEIIVPLIGKVLDGVSVYTFDQNSTIEKLASKHLAGFRITDDDLIIQIK